MMHAKKHDERQEERTSVIPEASPAVIEERFPTTNTLQRDVIRAILMLSALVALWALAWDRVH